LAGIAKDWKQYTNRDKILLCSSILPLFISVLYMLFYLPVGVDWAYKGDALSGVFKMLTLGGLGLWWLADAYVAAKKAGSAW
jgi:type II secretory pathway component PulM